MAPSQAESRPIDQDPALGQAQVNVRVSRLENPVTRI